MLENSVHYNILYEAIPLGNYRQFSPCFYQSTRPHAIIEYSRNENCNPAIGFFKIN